MTELSHLPSLTLQLKGPNWQQGKAGGYSISLTANTEQPPGWYRLVLVAQNDAARQLLAQQQLFVKQNHNPHGADLLPESRNKLALVFLRHNPLRRLTLQWHKLPTPSQNARFSVVVRPISRAKAWFYMLAQVSRRHKAAGQSWSYIYRISRARSKRSGVDIALAKLVREYQPLLAHQLISCEPYSYWRQTKEPQLLAAYPQAQQHNIHFCLLLRAKAEPQQLLLSIHSVLAQQHRQWQLYLCSAANTLTEELQQLIASDRRIILLADNASLALAPHSYSMLLQEGDCLHPQALQVFAAEFAAQPVALLYCDHDSLNTSQQRIAPHFKPDWNPDLLLSQNYIGSAYMVRSDILQQGLQQQAAPVHSMHHWWQQHHYLLLLQALLALPGDNLTRQIRHLPLVLLHIAQKNQRQRYNQYTCDQAALYLQQLAAREGSAVLSVKPIANSNRFNVRYRIPRPLPKVSILIPTRDALDITRNCVNSVLQKTHYPNFEIIILDNQSQQAATLAWFNTISAHDKVQVIKYDHPFNYSAINNFGASKASGELLCLLNNDTEVINNTWLTEMVQHAIRPHIGCVGAKLYYFDNSIQHAGVILGLWGLAGHSHKNYDRYANGYQQRLKSVQNLSAVTAACLLLRKSVFEQVGGLDETHLTVAFNDVDLCLKVQQAGYRNLWTPRAELYHFESKSRGKEDTPEKKQREQQEIAYMQQKWPQIIKHDPCYSPHLTRLREDFSIDID